MPVAKKKPAKSTRGRGFFTRFRAPVRRTAAKAAPAATKAEVKKEVKKAVDNSVGKALGMALGGAIGGGPGSAIGAALGGGAQSLFRKITGFGDYKVSSNTLMASGGGMSYDSLPQFQNAGRTVRIQHREYIQDIITSSVAGAFTSNIFYIQPALTGSFPWLQAIAEQFEEYQVNGMIFEFKSNSSDALNSVNTALGTVIMATQYNVLSSNFVNKQQMEQYEFSCSGKPSINLLHPVECARGESPVYTLQTRVGPVSTGDQRLYDFGKFTIATNGMQGTSVNIGELWVSYDITFLKPRLSGASDVADHYQLGTGITTSAYFGSSIPSASSTSDLGSTLTNTTITIPSSYTGSLLVSYNVYGSTGTVASATLTPSAGATALNLVNGNAFSNLAPVGTNVSNLSQLAFFKCVGGGLITLSGGTLPGSPSGGDLYVISIPATLTN